MPTTCDLARHPDLSVHCVVCRGAAACRSCELWVIRRMRRSGRMQDVQVSRFPSSAQCAAQWAVQACTRCEQTTSSICSTVAKADREFVAGAGRPRAPRTLLASRWTLGTARTGIVHVRALRQPTTRTRTTTACGTGCPR
eukprot:scaffold8282_cov142-Isochrysis_galbana.AAC.1